MTLPADAPFAIGDIVETSKGAEFWGKVVSVYDLGPARYPGEPAGWRCDVLALETGFRGTLHVYPAAQLRRSPLSMQGARAARRLALEEAANLISANQIAHTSGGDILEPRLEGNRTGLAYAAAIRALATEAGK